MDKLVTWKGLDLTTNAVLMEAEAQYSTQPRPEGAAGVRYDENLSRMRRELTRRGKPTSEVLQGTE